MSKSHVRDSYEDKLLELDSVEELIELEELKELLTEEEDVWLIDDDLVTFSIDKLILDLSTRYSRACDRA